LLRRGLLEHRNLKTGIEEYRLSITGWEKVDELRKKSPGGDQCFVAMWFDESLAEVWINGFKPAIEAAGYKPIRIDLIEHNEKICDRIISEIRRSSLVVADFTGNRGGVYFEAGFARGLGLEVISTCREDDVAKLHFDTRQYNHITWTDYKELKEKLEHRIKATVPLKNQKNKEPA
jgi:nucleoside 2-deoxyribosyltransferase